MPTSIKKSCTSARPQYQLGAGIQIWYHLRVAVVYPKCLETMPLYLRLCDNSSHLLQMFCTVASVPKKRPRPVWCPVWLQVWSTDLYPRRILEISTASSSENTGTAFDLCMVAIPFTLVPVYTLGAARVAVPPVSRLGICLVSRPAGMVNL